MLHINTIREKSDEVKASEVRRGKDPKVIDHIKEKDSAWRKGLKQLEQLKHQRNVVSEAINTSKKAGDEATAQQKIQEMRSVVEEIKKQETAVDAHKEQRDSLLKTIGNLLNPEVPKGTAESDNVELKRVGGLPIFNFIPKDHIELGQALDVIELETAAQVAGARFFYLKNEAVLLDQALQQFAISILLKHKFSMTWPPFMLNHATLAGGVNLSEFQDTIYKIEDEDLYLIGTSEHPLVALKQNQVLEEDELPLKIGGISTCFRKEAGSHGRDSKGIFRVHQFNKVEQVVYCLPEDSPTYFTQMQAISEEIFAALGIPFRVVNICTGDIGNKQALQYDIEAWFPGQNTKQGAYREVTSCSNCTDYQSVTLNTKVKRVDGTRQYVHMLNNTALATPRVIVAILENFQREDGSVAIPEVLWPWMHGVKEIRKK